MQALAFFLSIIINSRYGTIRDMPGQFLKYNHRMRITRWFCVASLLFWSILPALGIHARQVGLSLWLEICTAQGVERIALNQGNDRQNLPDKNEHGGNHCPLCLLRFAVVLPENLVLHAVPFLTTYVVSWPEAESSRIFDSHYPAARPRAPPFIV